MIADNGIPVAAKKATTASFGYFTFSGIQTGLSYNITVSAKGQLFAPVVVQVNGDINDLVITASTPPLASFEK